MFSFDENSKQKFLVFGLSLLVFDCSSQLVKLFLRSRADKLTLEPLNN